MRATLIRNADAGGSAAVEAREIVEGLEQLGWSVTAVDASELESVLRTPADVVVVAGGDGTVGRVAKRLAGAGVPIAVIPTGTANNVARTLGVALEPRAALDAIGRSVPRDVDLGVVVSRGAGEELFIEGFGVGVFASVMGERATEDDKRLACASRLLVEELERYEPLRVRIDVDGRSLSGDFLLVSVLNLHSLGPALQLAPHARFDDGELDLVLVRPADRGAFIARLRSAGQDGDAVLPPFERHRARQVRIRDYGRWAHVDDRSCEPKGDVEVRIQPRAVRFLLPPTPGG